MYFSTCSTSYVEVEWAGLCHRLLGSDFAVLKLDVQHILSDPLRTSYQLMQTLKIYPEITLLEYYLNLRQMINSILWVVILWMRSIPIWCILSTISDGIPDTVYFEDNYWEMFSDWINSLLTLIAATNTRPECGSALKKYQSQHVHWPFPKIALNCPYLEECRLKKHRFQCTGRFCSKRKYLSILLLKKDLKRLAHAAMDCFKVRVLYVSKLIKVTDQ